MENLCLLRYGEIFLKGLNRKRFEDFLVGNIKKFLKKEKISFEIKKLRNRVLVKTSREFPFQTIFGLVSYSQVKEIKADLEEIKKEVLIFAQKKKFKSFRISAKTITNQFPYSNQKINQILGEFLLNNLEGKKVDLENPDLNIFIEIIDHQAYLFDKKTRCFGGLPVGCEGKVLALIENENSLLAALLMMKRGCSLLPIAFKKIKIDLLKRFSPFDLELKIIKNFKEIEIISKKEKIMGLVVGQTLDDFKEIKGLENKLIVFRPLIVYSRETMEKELLKYENKRYKNKE